MALSADDRFAIADLINMHGHLMDRGDFEGAEALFTPDVVYDVSAFGAGVQIGLSGAREAALALIDRQPLAHHVTNIVLDERPDGTVHAVSKGIGIMPDGSAGSVTYDDTAVRTPAGWRIAHRVVRPRRAPLRE
jgi:hypothetical protein